MVKFRMARLVQDWRKISRKDMTAVWSSRVLRYINQRVNSLEETDLPGLRPTELQRHCAVQYDSKGTPLELYKYPCFLISCTEMKGLSTNEWIALGRLPCQWLPAAWYIV